MPTNAEFEATVLDSIKRQPDFVKMPDGRQVEWSWNFGTTMYTKSYILENWGRDKEMTQRILDRYMDLMTHLGRKMQ